MCVHVFAGVWEGEVADREEPAEGLHGRAVGEPLLLVSGGVQGRPAEPRAGPVFAPLLPRDAACKRRQRRPPAQACCQPPDHQHRPYRLLGIGHAGARFPQLARPLGEWAWLRCEERRAAKPRQPGRQRVHAVGIILGKIQPDSDSRFLPGNDWEMYNRRAAEEGLR